MNMLLDCYEAFRDEGKIRFIGPSIKSANVTDDTIALHRQYLATGRIDAIQLIYSVFRAAKSRGAGLAFCVAGRRGIVSLILGAHRCGNERLRGRGSTDR